jgi:RimJ/RimL family protein N-acetyltransferase
MNDIPVLQTARLRLRPHAKSDYQSSCAMWADPVVTRFIGGRASTPLQTWQRMLAYAGHWKFMHYGYWAIEEQSTQQFIGEMGFADFKRDIAASMQNVPEIGFAFASSVHGKGYATEALQAVLAWGDEHLPSKRTVALVNQENAVSRRLLEKNGYRTFEHAAFGDAPVLFMERLPWN